MPDRVTWHLSGRVGHEVRTDYDGLTALEVAADFRPDVVLLDIGLPSLDGYEVAARLRQQSKLQPIVIVANCCNKRRLIQPSVEGAAAHGRLWKRG